MTEAINEAVRGTATTVTRDVRCKDCLRELRGGLLSEEATGFEYNESWAERVLDRGGSRSDRCPRHRKRHRQNIQGIAVAYIDLATIGEVADREHPSGPLGGLGPLPDLHRPVETSVDLEQFKFGLTDRHVLEMLDKLRDKPVLVLKAGTGTGKSTFGPFRLLNPPPGAALRLTDHGPIIVTEPRIEKPRVSRAFP